MPAAAFYVSGHGFGHAARQRAVIEALQARRPDLRIAVRTPAPAWCFDRVRGPRLAVDQVEVDAGVVQRDSLTVDVDASIARADAFRRTFPRRADAEAAVLAAAGIDLVVGDVPPLACAAAARAGIPAIVIGNFTWDWIYAGFPETARAAPALVPALRAAYATAAAAWRLPLHGGFAGVDDGIVVDVPLVAHRSRRDPDAVRRRLGLPAGRRLALFAFGRYGAPAVDWTRVAGIEDLHVVVTPGPAAGGGPAAGAGVTALEAAHLGRAGLAFEDLLAAVDVVVTKPGYGMIADCAANDAAILYTRRRRFPEDDVLIAGLPAYVRAAELARADLEAGRWQAGLDRLAAQPRPPRPAVDGAAAIARRIAARLAARGDA